MRNINPRSRNKLHEFDVSNTVGFMGRMFGYAVALLMLLAVLPELLDRFSYGAVMYEIGFVESFQLGVLLLSLMVASYLLWDYEVCRELSGFFVLLLTVAMVRELDFLFGRLIPLLTWKSAVVVLLICYVCTVRPRLSDLKQQLFWLMRQRSVVMLWCGMLLVVVIAQLLGHGRLLKLLFQDHYLRAHKRFMEESLEAVGYLILLFGLVEYRFDLKTLTAFSLEE